MLDAWTAAKYLGVFGGGVMVAGFFLSGPVERPGETRARIPPPAVQSPATTGQAVSPPPAPPASAPSAESANRPQTQQPAQETIEPRTVRTIPVRKPNNQEPATAGAGDRERAPPEPEPAERDNRPAGRDASAQGAQCDVSACSRKYRSFDEATCTYQPYYGGRRRLCER